MSWFRVLAVVLPLAAALSACSGAAEPTAEEIAERMVAAQQSEEPLHVVSDMRMAFDAGMPWFGGVVMTMHSDQWQAGPDNVRVDMDLNMDMSGASIPGATGEGMPAMPAMQMTMVQTNGQVTMYMSALNSYAVVPAEELGDPQSNAQQATMMLRQVIAGLLDSYDITVLGRETVAGRDTIHLGAEPKPDAATDNFFGVPGLSASDVELWVDPGSWQTMKLEAVLSGDLGEMMSAGGAALGTSPDPSQSTTVKVDVDMEVTEFEVGVDPPAETFVFAPPPGAVQADPGELGIVTDPADSPER